VTFVSYAQNFEDIMLWRALKHVRNGHYVDIGAQHPLIDSVSRGFYEQGWRGVHIEPVHYYADLLRKDRPDETVLEVAISDVDGTLELNVISDTGLSTAVSAYAAQHQRERGFQSARVSVRTLTLTSAIGENLRKDCHWLKIDVEGLEEQVLKGWDPVVLRPWIIVVEAAVPSGGKLDYERWEPILRRAGYNFAYFDGLNRFYVATEHRQLADSFVTPPNVFDDAVLGRFGGSWLTRNIVAAHAERERRLVAETREAEARQGELQRQIEQMMNSRSWRVTAPLRELVKALKAIRSTR
jgi:FkbM family methyltransferase